MPIKGLSEIRRLPRLGKIHLGERATSPSGKEYPRATEHFVVPADVEEVYGPTPVALDVMFPVEDEEVFAAQFYRAYSRSRGLVCKGDGASELRGSSTRRRSGAMRRRARSQGTSPAMT